MVTGFFIGCFLVSCSIVFLCADVFVVLGTVFYVLKGSGTIELVLVFLTFVVLVIKSVGVPTLIINKKMI